MKGKGPGTGVGGTGGESRKLSEEEEAPAGGQRSPRAAPSSLFKQQRLKVHGGNVCPTATGYLLLRTAPGPPRRTPAQITHRGDQHCKDSPLSVVTGAETAGLSRTGLSWEKRGWWRAVLAMFSLYSCAQGREEEA